MREVSTKKRGYLSSLFMPCRSCASGGLSKSNGFVKCQLFRRLRRDEILPSYGCMPAGRFAERPLSPPLRCSER